MKMATKRKATRRERQLEDNLNTTRSNLIERLMRQQEATRARDEMIRKRDERIVELSDRLSAACKPVPMRLNCPNCGTLHIDEGDMVEVPHRTHACQNCGLLWAPAVIPTVGVRFLPGCRNEVMHGDTCAMSTSPPRTPDNTPPELLEAHRIADTERRRRG
jgi:hypothetical protein